MALLNTYECTNEKCIAKNKEIEVWVSLGEDLPKCEACSQSMTKIWKLGGVKTSDGFKR